MTDAASQEQKKDAGKPPMELLDSVALEQLALVLGYGAEKYTANGWRDGILFSRVIAAILRHTFAYLGGETHDKETGLSHMAHAMCEAMFLLNYEQTHPELDDRHGRDTFCADHSRHRSEVPNATCVEFSKILKPEHWKMTPNMGRIDATDKA